MYRSSLQPPLTARNGLRLRVLGIARISTEHQDKLSLEDQEALYRQWLDEHTDLPYDLKMIAGQGSGECLDRTEARQAQAELETGGYDLVIAEDLGRIFRRIQAFSFCEEAEDQGTRLIALNDNVDTANDGWRMSACFAAIRHEMYNADTAKRIRRSLRNRFSHGGILSIPIFGYIKPPGAKSEDELQKDPAAEPIYDRWFQMLEDGASFAEVADWLNAERVPLGPYARSEKWTSRMVGRITRNPILKGVRERNRRIAKRLNRTGRRRTVAAPPEELLQRECPHLAFFDAARFDGVQRLLKKRNAGFCRGKNADGIDPLKGRPKKRSIWPGQHIHCGICGRLYVYGGHGQKDHLVCTGTREYRCWNGATVNGPDAAEKLSGAILAGIASIQGYEEKFTEMIAEELAKSSSTRPERLESLHRDIARIDGQIANLVKFVRDGHGSASTGLELRQLEAERDAKHDQAQSIVHEPDDATQLPTVEALKQLVRDAVSRQADDPHEFARLMRRLIPRIVVYPYRLCDGGKVVLRARFTIELMGLASPTGPGRRNTLLQRELTVDLFDPPQRVSFRQKVLELRATQTEREAAKELCITHTAAQRAAALDRMMAELGLTDPYVALLEPPQGPGKLCRHKHPRYRFEASPEHPG